MRKRKSDAVRTKYDRMFERRNQDILTDHYTKMIGPDDDEEPDDGNGEDADEGDDDGYSE